MAAYLYVRATDSWNAINDELGLRPNFDEEIGEHLLAVELLRYKDSLMRTYAFWEDDAIHKNKNNTVTLKSRFINGTNQCELRQNSSNT